MAEQISFRARQGLTWGSTAPALTGFTTWHRAQHQHSIPVNCLGVNNAGPLSEVQDSPLRSDDDILIWRDSLWSDGFNPNNPNYEANPENEAEYRFHYKYNNRWPPELDMKFCFLKDENETRTRLADDGSERMWDNLAVGEWQGRYNLRFAQLAVQHERRVVLLSISSGDHDVEFWNHPSMIQLLAYAAANRYYVMIGLHEYSYVDENLFALMGNDNATVDQLLAAPMVDRKIGRFILLFDFCNSVGIDWPTLYFPEWGWAQDAIPRNSDDSMDQIDVYWELVAGPFAEYIAGMGTWWSDEWTGSNPIKYQVQELIPKFAQLAIDKVYTVVARRPEMSPQEPCEGLPRIQYRREYWYYEPSILPDAKKDLFEMAELANVTIGPSADDAGIGALDNKTAVGWDIPESKHQVYRDWFAEHYPGTTPVFRTVLAPPIEPPPEGAPGFNNPVEPVDSDEVWPEHWIDVTQFGLYYTFGDGKTAYHEAADLNKNEPHWDADRLAPVYAPEDGVVIFSGRGSGTWGNVVVIKHDHDGFGHVYSRSAHLDRLIPPVGAVVQRGDMIGQVGDAFGQLAYHLHYGFAVTDILETNPGHWPGNDLSQVVENYIDPASLTMLSRPGYTWPERSDGWISSNVNFRCGPNTTYTVIRIIEKDTQVTVLNTIGEFFLLLSDGQYGWVHEDFLAFSPPEIEPEGTHTYAGLHASANNDMGLFWELVRQEFLKLKPEIIKVQSFHNSAMIATLAAENKMTCKLFIVRAFLSFHNRTVPSHQFVSDTISDVRRSVSALTGQGIDPANIIIELHNEMNLAQEGWGSSWADGLACGAYFTHVVTEYKKILPTVQYGIGGLSPGGADPQRAESREFATGLKNSGIYSHIDVNFTHVYTVGGWNGPYEVTEWIDWNMDNMPHGDKVIITESSYHTPVVDGHRVVIPGTDYAAELNVLMDMLDRRPVLGVTFFVSDASNRDFRHECWVISEDPATPYENGESRGIATELRRLRPL